VYWVSYDNDLVAQTTQPILNSSNTVINSYNTHRFRILVNGQKDSDQGAIFVKGPYEETISVFSDKKGDLQVVQVSKFDEFHERLVASQLKCGNPNGKEFSKCLSRVLYKDREKELAEQTLVKHYRNEISNSLRNYTCKDPLLQSSEPISSKMVTIAHKAYNVSTLLDLESAKIWTVPDFITDDECAALIKHGSPKLTRATVAGEDGLFTVSQSRKAQQASYRFKADAQKDPLW
jgi:hypothetical protein